VTAVYVTVLALLSAAGALTLVRAVRGPALLDRIIAMDVVITLIVGAISVGLLVLDEPRAAVLLVVVALLAFVGTVAAAHLVEEREDLR
jgi:multicomponent Na+:H+ antiporter subunit F